MKSIRRVIIYCFISFIVCVFVFGDVFANSFYYEAFVATETEKVEFTGEISGEQFGSEIISSDFNDDGIDDLLVGSPFSSTLQRVWNGAVYVFLGGAGKFSNEHDFVFLGESEGDQMGTSLISGDFNGDLIQDIAIGAYNASEGQERPGKVYVYYGSGEVVGQSMDFAVDEPDLVLFGESDGDGFGLSMESLDVANDGIEDLIVGAPFARVPYVGKTGRGYVFLGGERGLSALHDQIINGQVKGERFGAEISGGDINGDGRSDLVIGAYFGDRVYFYDNSSFFNRLGNYTITVYSPTAFVEGEHLNNWFGFSIYVGDFSGDLKDDIAVSYFPYLGDRTKGKVAIFYGGSEFDTIPDLITGESHYGVLSGSKVVIEDLDGDSRKEIIIGAPGVGNPVSLSSGDLYVNYYDEDGVESTSVIHGEKADDWFGYSFGVLDFNNDGYKDLAVGSRYSDGADSVNNGKVFLLFGSETPFGGGRVIVNVDEDYVKRGEFINIVITEFNLRNAKRALIEECYEYREFCFFNFLSMSGFDGIELEPDIVLYPDLPMNHKYYEPVTIGTMLGLVNGYLEEEGSPFHPEREVSRIQALKIILGAADLVPTKYRFELVSSLGSLAALKEQASYFPDVNPKIDYMWWYPRYVNFAVESGIVEYGDLFRPDDYITREELTDMIVKTLDYLNSLDEEAEL